METSDIKHLKELEAENRKLKQMFAELRFKISASGGNHKKALVPTKERKDWALELQKNHPVTTAMSCLSYLRLTIISLSYRMIWCLFRY